MFYPIQTFEISNYPADRLMVTPLLADFVGFVLGSSIAGVSLFLILLILVQRGRGGGLTGALGGPGGQSAFGTKAGDLFTRITSFVALGWITLCAFTVWLYSPAKSVAVDPPASVVAPSAADAAVDAINPTLDLGTPAEGQTLTPAAPAGEEAAAAVQP